MNLDRQPVILKSILFFTTILSPILLGYLILKNSVNVPYMDDWGTPGLLLLKIGQGEQINFQDFFSQHNETRPAFPRLIFGILALFTGWDVRYQMILTFLLACIVAFNIFYLSQKTVSRNPLKLLFLSTIANLLVFSPLPTNWLWGIQTIVLIPIACITSCAAIFYSNLNNKIKLLIGMCLATFSTFSYANGILAWIVTWPLLLFSESFTRSPWQKKKWFLGLWSAGFIVNATLYFHNYSKPGYHPSFLEAIVHPLKAFGYFFAFLGSPLCYDRLFLSQIVGFTLVLSFVSVCLYLFKFRQDKSLIYRMTPWLIFTFYSLISGAITTAGRVGLGVEQALSPRYITFSLYLSLALIYLIAIIFQNAVAKDFLNNKVTLITKLILCFLTSAFIYTSINNFNLGANLMNVQRIERVSGKSCLLLANVFTDENCIQTKIYPVFNVAKVYGTIHSNHGFLNPKLVDNSIFQRSDKQGEKLANVYGFIDQFTKLAPKIYTLVGWAIVSDRHKAADSVVLTYKKNDGSVVPFAITEVGIPRPDVARALHQPNYRISGWQTQFSSDLIAEGVTKIGVWAFDTDTGKAYMIKSIPLESL